MDRHEIERRGFHGTMGAVFALAVLWVISLLVQWVVTGELGGPRDATDPVEGERSGMALHTDAQTGCQYLSADGGGITPRLDRDGRHICNP